MVFNKQSIHNDDVHMKEEEEAAIQLWHRKIGNVHDTFTEMCEETNWNYMDWVPDPVETLYYIGVHNRIEWSHNKGPLSDYERNCRYFPSAVGFYGEEPVLFPHFHIRSAFYVNEVSEPPSSEE